MQSHLPVSCRSRRICALSFAFIFAVSNADGQWTQWGGPTRDFHVDAAGLASQWPAAGPPTLWKRDLGDGYSSILVDDGTLYTMYRVSDDEFTIALRARDGTTVWEYKNPSPFTKIMAEFGPGPHATPLIVGARLYSVGTNAVLHCFDKASGRVLWKHDLIKDFDGELRARGYSCSPIAYKKTVILPVGSEKDGPGAVALDQESGEVVWKAPKFRATYAAPILIDFQGQTQLVLFMASELVGVNPDSGAVLWTFKHQNQVMVNASTPIWDGKDILFCANAYDGGAVALRLTRAGDQTVPTKLWDSPRLKLHHGNALLIGEYLYASDGMGVAFYTGTKLATGENLFRQRGFSKTSALAVNGRIILLDEDGQLALAEPGVDSLKVICSATVAEPFAWAAPTLVGATLYLRDRKQIMALDLGQTPAVSPTAQ